MRETLLHCLESLAGHAVAQNDIQQAIAFTRRIVEIEPWREAAQRRLMELLAESGQRAAALKQYESLPPGAAGGARRRAGSGHTGALRPVDAPGDGRRTPVRQRFLTTTDYTLVGRHAEQQKLRAIWRGLTGPHFVWIAGEAGIGKTRLAEDLLMLAEHEAQPGGAHAQPRAGRPAGV